MTARGRVLLVSVLAALAYLVLVWGAGARTPLLTAPSSERRPPTADPDIPSAAIPTPTAPPPPREEPIDSSIGIDVDWVLVLVLLLCGLLLLIGLLVKHLLARSNEAPEPVPLEDDELDALVEATSAEQRAVLAAGDPRNAVVACWVALEDAVSSAGLERSPAETSLDLATRVLGRWRVDRGAVDALAGLYREARFSRHPVTQQEHARAMAALEQINTDLRSAARRRDDEQAALDERDRAEPTP